MPNADQLIGFLTGTIGTATVGFLVEQFNKYQEHRRDMQKQVFIKKIDRAERAVGYYYTFLNIITEIKAGYEVMVEVINDNPEEDFEIEVIQKGFEINGKKLTELTVEKLIEINAISESLAGTFRPMEST